jgi:hypothetical protein
LALAKSHPCHPATRWSTESSRPPARPTQTQPRSKKCSRSHRNTDPVVYASAGRVLLRPKVSSDGARSSRAIGVTWSSLRAGPEARVDGAYC